MCIYMYMYLCNVYIHCVQEKTPPFVLQYISNNLKLIQIKFATVVALNLQIKDTQHIK